MVRMSDILRKAKERKEKEQKEKDSSLAPEQPEIVSPAPGPGAPTEAKVPPKEKPTLFEQKKVRKERRPQAPEIKISPVIIRESRAASAEETEKLYQETLSLVKEVMKEKIDYQTIDIKKISAQIEKLANQLKLGNDMLIMLALTRDSADTFYLFCHVLNTCILSIEVGLASGYEKPGLIELGVSTLLHDVGMAKYKDLANQPRRLTSEEHNEIKNHSPEGANILKKIKGMPEQAVHCAEQHHERVDGSGYPGSIKGESITKYAKIISTVDVFEAMMHPRVYRNEYPSLETMQELLTHKNSFEYRIIKTVIENIGIFPMGSFVRLNTNEAARVIKLNRKVPLRPVLDIIVNAGGQKLEQAKRIDLSGEPNIFITKGIRKNELE